MKDDVYDVEAPRLYLNHVECLSCGRQWYDAWISKPTYDCLQCGAVEVRLGPLEKIAVAATEVQAEIDAGYEALVRALRRADPPEVAAAFLIAIACLARKGEVWQHNYEGLISKWTHMEERRLNEIAVMAVEPFGEPVVERDRSTRLDCAITKLIAAMYDPSIQRMADYEQIFNEVRDRVLNGLAHAWARTPDQERK